MAQPWNLGPPVQDFTSLGNLGKAFTDAYDTSRKRALEEDTLASLGQAAKTGDYTAAGNALIARGKVAEGAALLQLGQKNTDREFDRSLFGGTTSIGALGKPAPASVAALGQPNEIENQFVGTVKQAGLTNPVGLGAVAAYGNAESSYDPRNVNRVWNDPSQSGQPGQAGGIMSWREDRLRNLQAFAKQRGEDQPSVQTQALFLAQEDPTLLPKLQAAKTPDEANRIMASAWRFAGYDNPASAENTRRLALTQQYAQRYGQQQPQQGVPQPQGVQVAETEADVQRLEAQQAAQGQLQGGPVASVPGDDPIKLRQAAQAYAQTNPEAARQLNARADAAEARGVQVAQAAPQPGSSVADVPAQGAQPAQFVIPGATPQQAQSIASDPNVQKWSAIAAQARTEQGRAYAKSQFDLAVKDAEQRVVEGRNPETVKEFLFAKRNGMTQANSPAEYAREKAAAPSSIQEYEYEKKVNGFKGTLLDFQKAQAEGKNQRQTTSDKVDENATAADKLGLQGDDRKFFVANGRLPTAGEKVTEGQANAALYADRMRAADTILNKPEAIAAAQSRFQQIAGANSNVGSVLNSEQYKLYNQAKLDFITAKLRRESGAAISASEFEKDDKTFFPQPNDPPSLITQKADARKRVIEGIGNAAGPSYAKRQAAAQEQATEKPAIPGGRVAPDGNTYVPDPNRPGKYLMVQP